MELDFKFSSDGLIPAIVQQAADDQAPVGRVLMLAWMNREALEKSLETGLMHYWSRSRKKLWLKGETSGHTQKIKRDVLLVEVEQAGGACHTGYNSCFFQEFDRKANALAIVERKTFNEAEVYSK